MKALPLLLPSALLLAACFRDDGIVGTPTGEKPVLARYGGPGVSEMASDTSRDFQEEQLKRVLAMTRPQVALVWQFVGPKEFIRAPTSSVVEATSPFRFELELRDPPPAEVLDNFDMAIGQFWLYSDRDGNGTLDRLIHPESVPVNAQVDSLYRAYQEAMDAVLEAGEVRESPVLWTDTFYVGTWGTVTLHREGREDTLFSGLSPAHAEMGPQNAWGAYQRLLATQTRWERFFALRKRDNQYYGVRRPAAGYAYAYELTYHRRIFPKAGAGREFEARCRAMIAAYTVFVLEGSAILGKANAAGYQDYPYTGFAEAGEDFVLARSRSHFVVYLRSAGDLAMLRDAERTSSFQVRGLERLKLGYNLIACDDQYRCQVLPDDAPVRLDMGMSDAFFNPPQSRVAPPVRVALPEPPPPLPLTDAFLGRFAGVYDCIPYGMVEIAPRDGSLWARLPEDGLVRLSAVDSLVHLTPFRNLQLQFVMDDSGRVAKVFIVRGSLRYVGARVPGSRVDGLERSVDALLAPRPAPLPAARAEALAALDLDWAGDTLKVERAGGDSLRVTVPGMFPLALIALDSATFAARSLDLRVAFAADGRGSIAGAWVERPGSRVFVPARGHVPPGPREAFPGLPDTLADTVSSHGGGARDLAPTLDGKPRFAGADDSLLLAPGDGWLDGAGASPAGGAHALGAGGDFLRFRVPALDARAVALKVTLRPERGAGRRRARFALWGGAAADRQETALGAFWVEFADKPVEVVLGPVPAGASPYWLRLERVATPDAPIHAVAGGYVAVTD